MWTSSRLSTHSALLGDSQDSARDVSAPTISRRRRTPLRPSASSQVAEPRGGRGRWRGRWGCRSRGSGPSPPPRARSFRRASREAVGQGSAPPLLGCQVDSSDHATVRSSLAGRSRPGSRPLGCRPAGPAWRPSAAGSSRAAWMRVQSGAVVEPAGWVCVSRQRLRWSGSAAADPPVGGWCHRVTRCTRQPWSRQTEPPTGELRDLPQLAAPDFDASMIQECVFILPAEEGGRRSGTGGVGGTRAWVARARLRGGVGRRRMLRGRAGPVHLECRRKCCTARERLMGKS
eukprot:scaffold56720_cov62-Phaeocystis_antarctica.AAC.2